ncbi:hypothetical protein DERP_004806 [Dermatophagoides pteronyssinus]|uniref:Uncharacterized protein n=1 Tax=Dermatophagoides pteronyssinus TaxID=6956 RepID=A0ABQ8JTL4_DERPT|nr:hypothetical protein DERP_004806 [Dermatophagoides pteronyssinus]
MNLIIIIIIRLIMINDDDDDDDDDDGNNDNGDDDIDIGDKIMTNDFMICKNITGRSIDSISSIDIHTNIKLLKKLYLTVSINRST